MVAPLPPPPNQFPNGDRHPKPSNGQGQKFVTYSSGPPPKPDPGDWWPLSRWRNTQKLIIGGGVLLVLIIIGAAFSSGSSDGDKSEPSGGTELCDSLRDPKDRQFTRGDYERMLDMEDWEIQRYVLARCPDQYDRVD